MEDPAAKSDDFPVVVANRKDEASLKPVVERMLALFGVGLVLDVSFPRPAGAISLKGAMEKISGDSESGAYPRYRIPTSAEIARDFR
jgi:hypothetical protein